MTASFISHSISQEQYLMWLWFLVHTCKLIIFQHFFHFFKFLIFWILERGRGAKGQKMTHNYQFQSVTLRKNKKIKILKNWKKCWRYYHFTNVYQKPQSYEVPLWRYGVRDSIFVILDHFLPFYTPSLNNPKKLKKWKKKCFIGFLSLKALSHNWTPSIYSNL